MAEMLVHMALSILLSTIKNAAHRAKFNAALKKLRDELIALDLDATQ